MAETSYNICDYPRKSASYLTDKGWYLHSHYVLLRSFYLARIRHIKHRNKRVNLSEYGIK